MRRRLLGLGVSIALAAFGTLVLVSYVQSAHDSAAAAERSVSVLVVTKSVERGTKASDLEGKVELTDIPASTKIDGAVSDVDTLEGKVAVTDLIPGEQVLADRFDTPAALGRAGVPKGLLEVTVKLSPERAVGGNVHVGDTVAVLASFEPFDIDTSGLPADANAPKKTPNTTHVIEHKALVTNVQVGDLKAAEDASKNADDAKDGSATPDPAPTRELLVTLALDAESVQQVVFTAEYGTLWLSAEPSDAPTGELPIETRGTVYR